MESLDRFLTQNTRWARCRGSPDYIATKGAAAVVDPQNHYHGHDLSLLDSCCRCLENDPCCYCRVVPDLGLDHCSDDPCCCYCLSITRCGKDDGSVETIFAALYRSLPDVRLRRECLRTKDDGSVALDWVCGDDQNLPSNSPLLILLESHSCPLSGAVSLCNPFNLVLADEDFHKGFNNVYDKHLAASLRRIFKNHALLFEDIGGNYNIQSVVNAKSVRDFDDGLTRVSFGFKSVDDYYSKSSSSNSIKYVRTPLLCIQAANDPIAPSRGIPREDIKENPNCLLIVTPKGGHLGWVAGAEAPRGAPWTDPVVMDFLEHLERGKSEPPCSRPEHVNQSTIHQRNA